MVVGPDFSTSAKVEDYDEIDALLTAAYQSKRPARMVRQLRQDGDMWAEVKTPWLGRIGGYFALAKMREPETWACLVAMAVLPEFQNGVLAERNPNMEIGGPREESYRGPWRFGKRMTQVLALVFGPSAQLRGRPETILAIGRPAYFERLGWSKERVRHLQSDYPVSEMTILGCGNETPEVRLEFPPAFAQM